MPRDHSPWHACCHRLQMDLPTFHNIITTESTTLTDCYSSCPTSSCCTRSYFVDSISTWNMAPSGGRNVRLDVQYGRYSTLIKSHPRVRVSFFLFLPSFLSFFPTSRPGRSSHSRLCQPCCRIARRRHLVHYCRSFAHIRILDHSITITNTDSTASTLREVVAFNPSSILRRLWNVVPLPRATGMFRTRHANLLAIAILLLLHLTSAYNSYNYGIDINTILKRQVSSFYADSGIHADNGPNGSVPLRQEIRQLENDNLTWTLYILGLDMLQYTDQTQMLSWYQIAGISTFHFQLDVDLPIISKASMDDPTNLSMV